MFSFTGTLVFTVHDLTCKTYSYSLRPSNTFVLSSFHLFKNKFIFRVIIASKFFLKQEIIVLELDKVDNSFIEI